MSKKCKNVCRVLNYIGHWFILISTVTWYLFISDFASLVGIPITIKSFDVGLKMCVITPAIRNHKPIIYKKKGNNHNKIVLLAKSKWNSIVVLISKDGIDSNLIHDEFILINNVLKECYDVKDESKICNDRYKFELCIRKKISFWLVEKIQKVKSQKL